MEKERKFVVQLLRKLRNMGGARVERDLLKDYSDESLRNIKFMLLKLENRGVIDLRSRGGVLEDSIIGLSVEVCRNYKTLAYLDSIGL